MERKVAKSSSCTGTYSRAETQTVITYGEVFENAVIDIVASRDRNGLDLAIWAGGELRIAPEINYRDTVYRPPDLHASVGQAMRFPPGATPYGSVTNLFANIAALYREHLRLPEDLAVLATCWSFSSWIPELLAVPLTLCVTASRCQTRNLFQMFRSLSFRPLMVAELSRRLPFNLGPTLLVDDPRLSPRDCAFWNAANFPGMVVSATGGKLCQLTCSKAVVLRPQDPPDAWGEETIHLILPPTELAPLSQMQLKSIADELQPQLEMYRLRRLVGAEEFASLTPQLPDCELARSLCRCIPGDAEILRTVTPLLESQQQETLARRARDPQVVIVKAIWDPAHRPGKMSVTEITERVNAILLSSGELYVFNPLEIGWLLRKLRLDTRRSPNWKVVRFCSEIRERLHQLARQFELQLPIVAGCPECQRMQTIDKSPVV